MTGIHPLSLISVVSTLVQATTFSYLVYGNNFLIGLFVSIFPQLKWPLYAAAKVIFLNYKFDYITSMI